MRTILVLLVFLTAGLVRADAPPRPNDPFLIADDLKPEHTQTVAELSTQLRATVKTTLRLVVLVFNALIPCVGSS